jgi:hypothetical protein
MDSDRKYRQRGYQDTDRPDPRSDRNGSDRPRQPGLRPNGTAYSGNCPKCGAALHCCKQCSHFEPSTRFQCLKPIPVRIPLKDKANECTLFEPRVTVARDASPSAPPPAPVNDHTPRSSTDARSAFNALFKK